jgi:uncharacterized protein YecT (DUF1311 family)
VSSGAASDRAWPGGRAAVGPTVLLSTMSLVLAGAPAAAAACAEASDQATLNACATEQLKAAEAELAGLRGRIEQRLAGAPDRRGRFAAAQDAWLAFRAAECAFAAAAVEGGSAFPMLRADCLAGLTRQRGAELERYLACAEGDLSCPLPPN